MEENLNDSAGLLVGYWQGKCFMREPDFRNRMELIKNAEFHVYDNYQTYFGFMPIGQQFDRYTLKLAEQLKEELAPRSVGYLMADPYSGNTQGFFEKIQSSEYRYSAVYREYQEMVGKFLRMPEGHISWITGVWIPTGKLATLGVHPDLGFQAGFKRLGWNYDWVLTFRFLNSANYYMARRVKSNGDPRLPTIFLADTLGSILVTMHIRHVLTSGKLQEGWLSMGSMRSKPMKLWGWSPNRLSLTISAWGPATGTTLPARSI